MFFKNEMIQPFWPSFSNFTLDLLKSDLLPLSNEGWWQQHTQRVHLRRRLLCWAQFHQHIYVQLLVCSSQKHKNSVKLSVSFYTFGTYERKSCT